jgi:hypothetical protein
MNRTETMRQSARQKNEQTRAQLAAVRAKELTSVEGVAEKLAGILLPLAEQMAALSEETRTTLATLASEAQRQAQAQETAAAQWRATARKIEQALLRFEHEGQAACREIARTAEQARTSLGVARWKTWALMVASAVAAATLSVWLLCPPPPVMERTEQEAIQAMAKAFASINQKLERLEQQTQAHTERGRPSRRK